MRFTEQRAATPAGEQRAVTSAGEQRAVTSAGEQRAVTPVTEQRAVTPAGEQRAVTPVTEQRAVTPAGEQPAVTAVAERLVPARVTKRRATTSVTDRATTSVTEQRAATRVTKRRAETKARLLAAAFSVFAAKGFGQTRIDDVCAAAGYTRGAFYSNYTTLDELFFDLYDERAALIATQVTSSLTEPPLDAPVEQVIERTVSTLLLDRDWLLVKTDFLLHAARNPLLAHRLAGHRDQLRQAVQDRLASVRGQLTLPPSLDDVAAAARAVVAAYDGVTVQLLLDSDVSAARTWLTQLLTALLTR
jgi:AcrR family transcriptional regulator